MTSQEKKQLQITACKVRMGIIESTHAAKCGAAPLYSPGPKRTRYRPASLCRTGHDDPRI